MQRPFASRPAASHGTSGRNRLHNLEAVRLSSCGDFIAVDRSMIARSSRRRSFGCRRPPSAARHLRSARARSSNRTAVAAPSRAPRPARSCRGLDPPCILRGRCPWRPHAPQMRRRLCRGSMPYQSAFHDPGSTRDVSCPSYGGESDARHSVYRRRLQDLPIQGISVMIRLRVSRRR